MTEKSGGAEHRPTFLVTGATSGVGEAIATQLSERGARVLIGARTYRARRGRGRPNSEPRTARRSPGGWPRTFADEGGQIPRVPGHGHVRRALTV